MNKLIRTLMVLLCLAAPGLTAGQTFRHNLAEKSWLDQHQTLRIGVVELLPPLLTYAGGSNPQGLVADYLRALAPHLGLQLTITRYPDQAALMNALRAGEVDVLGAWSQGDGGATNLISTRPYLTLPMALYGVSEINPANLAGLRGKRVAVMEGDGWGQLPRIVPGLSVVPFATLEEALRAAAEERVFAYLGDAASADYLLKRNPIGDLELQQPVDLTYDISLATRSADADLLSLLQKGLDRIGPEELQEIWYRWPGVERPQYLMADALSIWLWLPLLLVWSAVLVWGVSRYMAKKELLRHAKLTRAIRHFQRREKRLKEKLLSLNRKTLNYRTESRQHRNRLRLVNEVLPSAAWVWEAAAECCQWDEQMFALFRQDPEGFRPTPEAILELVHEDDREKVAALFRESYEGGESHISYRVVLADGEIRWMLDFSNYSIDQTEAGEQRIGICWDVTEYIRSEIPDLTEQPAETT